MFLDISLKETQSIGSVWIYVAKDSTPDTRDYDYSDQETNTAFHSIQVPFATPTSANYYIGVYGNPFAIGTISFNIAAWSPNI